MVEFGWWLAIAGAAIPALAIAKRVLRMGRDILADHDFGPGDVDAGHYLTMGGIVWQRPMRMTSPNRSAYRAERFGYVR